MIATVAAGMLSGSYLENCIHLSVCLSVCSTAELSSYLANRVPEMEQLTDAVDYDQDFY